MRIQVTQEDIDQGEPGEPESCAVAKAIRRQLKPQHVQVTDVIEINNSDFEAPPAVIEFIERYDHGHRVQPFEFDLAVTQE